MKNEKLLHDLGKRIAALRKERGMSQDDFAEASGKMINTISNIERGLSDPKTTTLDAISKVLNVRVADLFIAVEKRSESSSGSPLDKLIKILEHEDEKVQKIALKQIENLLEMK